MKMVEVFNASGDKILACSDDIGYYASIGWKPKAVKVKPAKQEDVE